MTYREALRARGDGCFAAATASAAPLRCAFPSDDARAAARGRGATRARDDGRAAADVPPLRCAAAHLRAARAARAARSARAARACCTRCACVLHALRVLLFSGN